jgi:hypothetical protein
LRELFTEQRERPRQIGEIARDKRLITAIYRLPHRLFEMAINGGGAFKERHSFAQIATALEILLQAPLWPGMLASLRIGDIAQAMGPSGLMLIDPFGRHYQLILPASSYEIINPYLSKFRTLTGATAKPGDFLFVSFRGTRCIEAYLNRKIKHWGFKLLGVSLTLREYRYLAALVYLQRHDGDLETVRQLLGVRRLEWLKRAFYANSREVAFDMYDRLLSTAE